MSRHEGDPLDGRTLENEEKQEQDQAALERLLHDGGHSPAENNLAPRDVDDVNPNVPARWPTTAIKFRAAALFIAEILHADCDPSIRQMLRVIEEKSPSWGLPMFQKSLNDRLMADGADPGSWELCNAMSARAMADILRTRGGKRNERGNERKAHGAGPSPPVVKRESQLKKTSMMGKGLSLQKIACPSSVSQQMEFAKKLADARHFFVYLF